MRGKMEKVPSCPTLLCYFRGKWYTQSAEENSSVLSTHACALQMQDYEYAITSEWSVNVALAVWGSSVTNENKGRTNRKERNVTWVSMQRLHPVHTSPLSVCKQRARTLRIDGEIWAEDEKQGREVTTVPTDWTAVKRDKKHNPTGDPRVDYALSTNIIYKQGRCWLWEQ